MHVRGSSSAAALRASVGLARRGELVGDVGKQPVKLVTGGSNGIGKEIAARFAAACAAKAALAAWNLSASAELGPRGVTANVISAGYI
jgi:NAD(P)-dependent dehydrogenase (short-subunit alcohol dehydrogenase family)